MKRSSMTKKVLVLMAIVTLMLVILVGCGKTEKTSIDNMQQFVDPNTGSNTEGIAEEVGVKTKLSGSTAGQMLMDSIINANAVAGNNRYITFSFAPYIELEKNGKTTKYSLNTKGSIDTVDNDNSVFEFEVLKNDGSASDLVILGIYGINGDIYIDFNDFDSGNAVHRYYVDDADIAYLATVLDKVVDRLQIEGILTDFNIGALIGNDDVTSLLARLNLKTDSLLNLFFSLISDDGCYAITRSDGVTELVMPTKLNMIFQTPQIMSILNGLVSDLLVGQSDIVKGIVDFLAGDILSGAKVLDTYILAELKNNTFQKVALKINSKKGRTEKDIEIGAGSLAKSETMATEIKDDIANRVNIDTERMPYSFTTLSADVDVTLDLGGNKFSMSQIDSAIGGALSGLLTNIDKNVWTNTEFIDIAAHTISLHVKLRAEIDMKNNSNTKILLEINGTDNITRIGLYYYGKTHAVYVDLSGIGGGKYMTDNIDGEPIDLNKLIAQGIEKLIPEIPSIMDLINGVGSGSAASETSEYGQAIINAIQQAKSEDKFVVSHFGFAQADDAATTETTGDIDIMAILGCLAITMGDSTRLTIESIEADLTQDVINSILGAIGISLPVDALSLKIAQGRDENNYEGWDVDLHLNVGKTDEDTKEYNKIVGADIHIFINYGNPDASFKEYFSDKIVGKKDSFIDVDFLRKSNEGVFDNMWVNVGLGLRLNLGVEAGSDFDLSPLGQYILGLVIKLQGGLEGADVDLGIKIDAAVNIMTLIDAINGGADVGTILGAINARIEIGRYVEGGAIVDENDNSLLIILQDGNIYLKSDNLGVKYMLNLADILGGGFSLFGYDKDADAQSALVAEGEQFIEEAESDLDILSIVLAALDGIKLDNTALEVGIADTLIANLLGALGIEGFSNGDLAFSNDGTYIKLGYEGLNLSKLWIEANIGLQQEGTDSALNLGLGLGAIRLGLGNVDYTSEFSADEIAEFNAQNIMKGGNIQLGVQLGIDLSLAQNDISFEDTFGGLISDIELITRLNVVDELRSGLIIDIFANVDISSEPSDNDSQILIEILRSSDYTTLLGIYYDQATTTLYLDSDDAAIIQPVAVKVDLISMIMGLIGGGSAAADIDLSNLNPILLIGDGGVQIKVLSGLTELLMGLLVGDMTDYFEVSDPATVYKYYENVNGLDASITSKAIKDEDGKTLYFHKKVDQYVFDAKSGEMRLATEEEIENLTDFYVKANDDKGYFLVNYKEWLAEKADNPTIVNYTLSDNITGKPKTFVVVTAPVEVTEETAAKYAQAPQYVKVQYKLASTLCYNDLDYMSYVENGGFVPYYSANGLPRYIKVPATDADVQLYELFSNYNEELGKYVTTKKVYDETGTLIKTKDAYLKVPGLGAAICIGHYTNSSVSIVNPSDKSAGLGIGIFVTDDDTKAPFEYVAIGEEEIYDGTTYDLVDGEYVVNEEGTGAYKFDCSNTLANIAIKLDIQLSDKRFAWIHSGLGLSDYIASIAKKFADGGYPTADASNLGDLTVYLQIVVALELGADEGEYALLEGDELTNYTGKRYSYNDAKESYVEDDAGTYKFVGVDWNIGGIVSALAGSTTGETDALSTFLRTLLIKFNVLEGVQSTIGVRIAGNVKIGALLTGDDTATMIYNLLKGSEIAVEITDGDPYDPASKRVIALYVKDEMIYISLDGSLVTNTKLKLPVKQVAGIVGGLLASDSAMATEGSATADLDIAGILGIVNNCVNNISIYKNDTKSGIEIGLSKNIVGAIIGLVAGVDGVTGLELNESNSYIKLNTNISDSNPYIVDVGLGLDPVAIGLKLGGLKIGLAESDDILPSTFNATEYKGFEDFAENVSLDIEIGIDLSLYEGEINAGAIVSKILQGMGTDLDFPLVLDIQDELAMELRIQIAGNLNLNELNKSELKIAILNNARTTLPATILGIYIKPEMVGPTCAGSSLYIETNFATGETPTQTKDKVENFNLLDSILGETMEKLVAYLNAEVGGGALATEDTASDASEILLELASGSIKLEIASELLTSLLISLVDENTDETIVEFIEDLGIEAQATIKTSPDFGLEVRANCKYLELGILINKINLSLSKIDTIFDGIDFSKFGLSSTKDSLSIALGLDIDYNLSNGKYNYDNILNEIAKSDLFADDETLTTIGNILKTVTLDVITKNTRGTIGIDVKLNLLSAQMTNALASVSVVLCDLIMGALDSSYVINGEEIDIAEILKMVEAEIKIDINGSAIIVSVKQDTVNEETWICLDLSGVGGVPFRIRLDQILKTALGSSALATADVDTNVLVSDILQNAFASISIASGTGLDIALQSTFAQFLMQGVVADLLETTFNQTLVDMFQLKAPYISIIDADSSTIAYDSRYYQKVTEIRYNAYNAKFASQLDETLYVKYIDGGETYYAELLTKNGHETITAGEYSPAGEYIYKKGGKAIDVTSTDVLFVKKVYERYKEVDVYDSTDVTSRNQVLMTIGSTVTPKTLYDADGNDVSDDVYVKVNHSGIGWTKQNGLVIAMMFTTGDSTTNPDFYISLGFDMSLAFSGTAFDVLEGKNLSDFKSLSSNEGIGGKIFLSLTLSVSLEGNDNGALKADNSAKFTKITASADQINAVVTNTAYYTTDGKYFTNNLFVKANAGETHSILYTLVDGVYTRYTEKLYYESIIADETTYTEISDGQVYDKMFKKVTVEDETVYELVSDTLYYAVADIVSYVKAQAGDALTTFYVANAKTGKFTLIDNNVLYYKDGNDYKVIDKVYDEMYTKSGDNYVPFTDTLYKDFNVQVAAGTDLYSLTRAKKDLATFVSNIMGVLTKEGEDPILDPSELEGLSALGGLLIAIGEYEDRADIRITLGADLGELIEVLTSGNGINIATLLEGIEIAIESLDANGAVKGGIYLYNSKLYIKYINSNRNIFVVDVADVFAALGESAEGEDRQLDPAFLQIWIGEFITMNGNYSTGLAVKLASGLVEQLLSTLLFDGKDIGIADFFGNIQGDVTISFATPEAGDDGKVYIHNTNTDTYVDITTVDLTDTTACAVYEDYQGAYPEAIVKHYVYVDGAYREQTYDIDLSKFNIGVALEIGSVILGINIGNIEVGMVADKAADGRVVIPDEVKNYVASDNNILDLSLELDIGLEFMDQSANGGKYDAGALVNTILGSNMFATGLDGKTWLQITIPDGGAFIDLQLAIAIAIDLNNIDNSVAAIELNARMWDGIVTEYKTLLGIYYKDGEALIDLAGLGFDNLKVTGLRLSTILGSTKTIEAIMSLLSSDEGESDTALVTEDVVSVDWAGLVSLNSNTIAIELSKKIVMWAISLGILGLDEPTQAIINSLDASALLEIDYGAKYEERTSSFAGTKWAKTLAGRYVLVTSDVNVSDTSKYDGKIYERIPNIAINVSADVAKLLGVNIAIKNIKVGNTTIHGQKLTDFVETIDANEYAELLELLFGRDETGAIALQGFDPKLQSLTLEVELDAGALFTESMYMNTGIVEYEGVNFGAASLGSIGSGSMGLKIAIKLEIAISELLNTLQAGFNTQDIFAVIQQVLPLLKAQISIYSETDGDEIVGIYVYDGSVFVMLDDLGMPNIEIKSSFLMEIVGALIAGDEGAALATEDTESDDTLTTVLGIVSKVLEGIDVGNKALTIALKNDYLVTLLDSILFADKPGYYKEIMPENNEDGFSGIKLNFNNLKTTKDYYLELATTSAPYKLALYYYDAGKANYVAYKTEDGDKGQLYYKTANDNYVKISEFSIDEDGEYYYNAYYKDSENKNMFVYSDKEFNVAPKLYYRVSDGLLSIDLDAYATHVDVDLYLPRIGTQTGIIADPKLSVTYDDAGVAHPAEFVNASDVSAIALSLKGEIEIDENSNGTALANILSGVVGDLETVLVIEDTITIGFEIAAGVKFKYSIADGTFAINDLNLRIGLTRVYDDEIVDLLTIYYINDDGAVYIDASHFFAKQDPDKSKNLGLLKVTGVDLVGLLSGLLASDSTTAVASSSDTSVWADDSYNMVYVEATDENTAAPIKYVKVSVLDETGVPSQSYNLYKGTIRSDYKTEAGVTLYVRDRASLTGYSVLSAANATANEFKAKYTLDYDYEYRILSNLYYSTGSGYVKCVDSTSYNGKALYTMVVRNEINVPYQVTDGSNYIEYYKKYNPSTCSYTYEKYSDYTPAQLYKKVAGAFVTATTRYDVGTDGKTYIKTPVTSLSMVWADFSKDVTPYYADVNGAYVLDTNGQYVEYNPDNAEHASLTRYSKVSAAHFDVKGAAFVNITGKAALGLISNLIDNPTLNSILDEGMLSLFATRDPFIAGAEISILDKYNDYEPAFTLRLALLGFDFTGKNADRGSYFEFAYNEKELDDSGKMPNLPAYEKSKYRELVNVDLERIINAYDAMAVLMDSLDFGDQGKLFLNLSIDLDTFAKNFKGEIQNWAGKFADLLGLNADAMKVLYTTLFDNIEGDGYFHINVSAAIDVENLIGGLLNGTGLNLEGTEIQITIDMDTMLFAEQLRAAGSKIVITAVGQKDGLLTAYIDFSGYRGKSKHKVTLNVGDLLGSLGASAISSADVETGLIPENIFNILNAIIGEVRLGNGRIYVGLKDNIIGSVLNALLGTNIKEEKSLISGGVYIDLRNIEIGIDMFLGEHNEYVESTTGSYVLVDGKYIAYDESAHSGLTRYNYVQVDGYNYSSEDEFYIGIIIGKINLLAPESYNTEKGTFITDDSSYKDLKELQLDLNLSADIFYEGVEDATGLDISSIFDLVGDLLGQPGLFGTDTMKMLIKEDSINAVYTLTLNAHLDLADFNNMRVALELSRKAVEGGTTYNELRLGAYMDGKDIYVDLSAWGLPKVKIAGLNLGDTLNDLIGGLLDGIVVSDNALASASVNYIDDYNADGGKEVYVRAPEGVVTGTYVIINGKYVAYDASNSEHANLNHYIKTVEEFRDSWGEAIFPTQTTLGGKLMPYISLVLAENHFGFGINAELLNGLLASLADGLGMSIELPNIGDIALLFDAREDLTGDGFADTEITAVMQVNDKFYAGLRIYGFELTGYAANSQAINTFNTKVNAHKAEYVEAYNIATGEIGLERVSLGTTISVDLHSKNTTGSSFETYLSVLLGSLLKASGLGVTINVPTGDVAGCIIELRASLNIKSLVDALQGGISDWWSDVELYLSLTPKGYSNALLKLYKLVGDSDVYADLTGLSLFKVKIVGLGSLLGGLFAGDASSALSTIVESAGTAQEAGTVALTITLGQNNIDIDIGMGIINAILALLGETLTIEPATTSGTKTITDYDVIVIGEGAEATRIPIPVLSSKDALSVSINYPSPIRHEALALSIGLGLDDNNSINITLGNVAIGVGTTQTSNHIRYGATNGVINTTGTNVMNDISGTNANAYSGLVLNDAFGISLTNILTSVIKGINPNITIDWYKNTNHVYNSSGDTVGYQETRTKISLSRTTTSSETSGGDKAYAGKVWAKIDTYNNGASSTVNRSISAWLFNNWVYIDLGSTLEISLSWISAVTKLQITELNILDLLNGGGLALSASDDVAMATADEEEEAGLDIGSIISGIQIDWWTNTSVAGTTAGSKETSAIRIDLNATGINNLLASVYYLLYGLYNTSAPAAELFDETGLSKMVYEKGTNVIGLDGNTYTSVGAHNWCLFYMQSWAAKFIADSVGVGLAENLLKPEGTIAGSVLKEIVGALLPLPKLDPNKPNYAEIVFDKTRLASGKGIIKEIAICINKNRTTASGSSYTRIACGNDTAEIIISLNEAVKLNSVSSVKNYDSGAAIAESTLSTQTITVDDPFNPVELTSSALTEYMSLKRVDASFYGNTQYTSKGQIGADTGDEWVELGGTPMVWDSSQVNLAPGATSYVYGYALNYKVMKVPVVVSAKAEFMKLYGYFVDDGTTFVENNKIIVDPTKTPGGTTAAGLPSIIVILRKDGEIQVLSTGYDSLVEQKVTIDGVEYVVNGKFGWIDPTDEEIESGNTIDVKFWYQVGYSSRIQKTIRVKYENGSVESAMLPTGDKFDILTSGTALNFTTTNLDILGNLGLPAIAASNTFTATKDSDNNDCFKYVEKDGSAYYFYVGTAPTDPDALTEWDKHVIGMNGTFKRYFGETLLTEGTYSYVAGVAEEPGLLDGLFGGGDTDTDADIGTYVVNYSGWVNSITVRLGNGKTSTVEVIEWKYDDFSFNMANPQKGASGTIVAVINKYVVDKESDTGFTNNKQELKIKVNVLRQELSELVSGDIRFNQYNDLFVEDVDGNYVEKTVENVYVAYDSTNSDHATLTKYAIVDGIYVVETDPSVLADNTARYVIGSATGFVKATASEIADNTITKYSINIFGSDFINVRIKQSAIKSSNKVFETSSFVFYTTMYENSIGEKVYVFEVPELSVSTERNISVTALYDVNNTYEQSFGITIAITSKVAEKVVLITKEGQDLTNIDDVTVTIYYKDGTSTVGLAKDFLDIANTVIPENATAVTGIVNGKTTLVKADDESFTQKGVTLEIRVF